MSAHDRHRDRGLCHVCFRSNVRMIPGETTCVECGG